jgi:peptidyl-prolyl cis-trans isomerase C
MMKALCVCLLAAASAVNAIDYPVQSNAETVFAERGGEKLTFGDVDALVLKLAPFDRPVLVNDYDKFASALDSELINKQLATEAQKLGIDQDPVIARAMKRAAQAELARHTIEYLVDEKVKTSDFSALAEEIYLTNPDTYKAPLTSVVMQILVDSKSNSTEAAKALGAEIVKKARSGEDFAKLVQQYSSDPFKSEDKGIVEVADSTQIAKGFFDAAQGIAKVGDVTDLIETEYGMHVMKLIERKPARLLPFADVREQIINQLIQQNREKIRQEIVSNLRASSPQYDNVAFEELKVRYGRMPVKGVSAPGAMIVLPEMESVKAKPAAKPAAKTE